MEDIRNRAYKEKRQEERQRQPGVLAAETCGVGGTLLWATVPAAVAKRQLGAALEAEYKPTVVALPEVEGPERLPRLEDRARKFHGTTHNRSMVQRRLLWTPLDRFRATPTREGSPALKATCRVRMDRRVDGSGATVVLDHRPLELDRHPDTFAAPDPDQGVC